MKIDKKEIFDWLKILIIAFAIAFVVNNYVIVKAQVPTGSMENTVMVNDRIIALRTSYLFDKPKRGDIIIFKYPDDESQNYLKRVIGLPGETIEIKDGKVYINKSSKPLEETYLRETPIGSFGPYVVPADSYFMMGDNRNNSEDARFWDNTYVKKNKIIGKAIIRYYPSLKLLK